MTHAEIKQGDRFFIPIHAMMSGDHHTTNQEIDTDSL